MKKYPVKEFLKKRSRLVKLREKEQSGKVLTQKENAQAIRIYELQDETLRRISKEISRYYERVINGDYRFDGMPNIRKGMRGWIEAKIWRLLVEIGEPDCERYQDRQDDFWTEAK